MGFFQGLIDSASTLLPGHAYGTLTPEQQVVIDGVYALLHADGDCTLAESTAAATIMAEVFQRDVNDLEKAFTGRGMQLAGLSSDEILATITGKAVDKKLGGLSLLAGLTACMAMNGNEGKGYQLEPSEDAAARQLAVHFGVADKLPEAMQWAAGKAPEMLQFLKDDPFTPTS